MPKKKTGESIGEIEDLFEIAKKLFNDGKLVKVFRRAQGLSKKDAAKNADISIAKVSAYERPGQVKGNFWLFCYYIRGNVVDPRLIGDQGYLDEILEEDPDNSRKEGDIGERDNWYEWSEKKFKKFRRWAHRKYIEKMPDQERKKPIPKKKIRKWYDDWVKAGRPDANEIVEE